MRKVKALFDPDGRLNPGVMVDAAPMTVEPARPRAAARAAAAARTSPSASGGMRAAADRCQRIGACRKTGQGVMCPSYMATREEEHATRGRANALVKALSRARPARRAGRRAAARDPRPLPRVQGVQERVPAERRHGDAEVRVPLALPGAARDRRCARGCSARSGGSTGSAPRPRRCRNLPACRAALLERVAGIDRRRPLPRFARETLLRWDAAARAGARGAARRRRLPRRLVHDLHRARDRPRGDRAARGGGLERAAGERRLLRALEHLQGPARPGARRWPRRWSTGSRPRPSAASPIVGCEPSCLLTLREEHLGLLPGDPRAQAVADARRGSSRSCSSRRSTTAR